MIILRTRSYSKDDSKTPIYDKYLHNLSKGQARYLRSEDNDRKKLNLEPYIQDVEKKHGYEYKSLKRPIDYEDESKTVEDFKKFNQLKNKVAGGTIGGGLGILGGMAAGVIKTKNSDKALLAGLAGAGLGTLAGIKVGKTVGGKKDERLIKEALEERRKESETKFKKRSKA